MSSTTANTNADCTPCTSSGAALSSSELLASGESQHSSDEASAGVIAAAAVGSLAAVGAIALFIKARQGSSKTAEEHALQVALADDEVKL